MVRAPDPSIFDRPFSWAVDFVWALQFGTPERVPPDHNTKAGRETIRNAAKRYGLTINIYKFGGEYWVLKREPDLPRAPMGTSEPTWESAPRVNE